MAALPADLPPLPSDDSSHSAVSAFASRLQIVVEQFNLLLSLVGSATYKWGVDRSGASQQNLGVMVAELQTCQEMISSGVSGRLSNVLCPAVDVMVGEVEIIRGEGVNDGANDDDACGDGKKRKLNDNTATTTNNNNTTKERRINHYIRTQVDPAYVHLSHVILARNAEIIRHTVATSIYTAQKVISDYLKAMKREDGGGHSSFNL